ncbi:GFA family protein [Haematobacter genomosp. 1]|nr:GFA family protein [Haematobacter genomosp. 1]
MNGRCLCGHVSFTLRETPEGVVICRCPDCRRWSGNAWASVSVPLEALEVRGTPVWYRSSAHARRGFCGGCGASLFWQPVTEEMANGEMAGGERIAVSAGALDLPTGLSVLREEGDPADFQQAGPLPAEPRRLTGRCLCGGVTGRLAGPAGAVEACHCSQCRRMTGHHSASFGPVTELVLSGHTLRCRATGTGHWKFCGTCGSTIGFSRGEDTWVDAGFIDPPTGGRLTAHIFTAFKGDYYEIADGLPQAAER